MIAEIDTVDNSFEVGSDWSVLFLCPSACLSFVFFVCVYFIILVEFIIRDSQH